MTIRTKPGPLSIGAGDFQLTFAGVTVALKLTFIEGPMGPIANIRVAEKVGAEWVEKDEILSDFGVEYLKTRGVAAWLQELLIPRFNAWLAERFGRDPEQVPDWVPEQIVELDAALRQLKVAVVNGVPQVSV